MFPDTYDDMTVSALRCQTDPKRSQWIANSVNQGFSRFGWSWLDSHDLRVLKHEQPDDHHRDIYQHCRFLLLIRPGDWIVHVNAPEKGGYIAVPVIGTVAQGDGVYLYDSVVRPEPMDDFRSMIPVDPVQQVRFSNRDLDPYGSTYESLTSRGRYHRVSDKAGFFQVLRSLPESARQAQS